MSEIFSKNKKGKKVHPFFLLVIAICLGVIGQLALKKGLGSVGVITLSGLHWGLILSLVKQPFIVGGFCCYFLSAGLYMVVISQVPLSYAYPLVSMGYILVVIFSKVIFNEQVTIGRWLGVVMICAGVIIIARTGATGKTPAALEVGVTHGTTVK